MQPGLNSSNAVGRAGGYRQDIWTEVIQLGTVIARGREFFRPGPSPVPLLSLDLPADFTRQHLRSCWTGRSYRYRWPGGSVELHLATTLPGPLFARFGQHLRLRFAFGNAPAAITDLESGRKQSYFVHRDLGRLLLLDGPGGPSLIASSHPVRQATIVSHEHLSLQFDCPDARVIWSPLLPGAAIPRDRQSIDLWVRLAASPPLSCQESYQLDPDHVRIRQEFTDLDGVPCRLAPLPPMAALLGSHGQLQHTPAARPLTKTLIGPYSLVEGSSFDWTIDIRWSRARLVPTRCVAGALARDLSPIPDELAYAGDVSWQPGTPLDQCLALRVWAPLAAVAPPALWARLRPQLAPPSPEQLRESLKVLVEPFTAQAWAKDANLFSERGEVSYDSDFYNGLTLSGMYRGLVCADRQIAEPCWHLATNARDLRRLLFNYMWLFHDWALCCAWSDPRGETWNLDCSHNGLEGVLAEARIRQLEGDHDAAGQALYLAARMSVAFLAAYPLADWCRQIGFVFHDAGEPHLGISDLREWRGVAIDSPATPRPYALAGNFPEFCSLLHRHGPVDRLRRVARLWQQHYPQRYTDWEYFYTGGKRTAQQSLRQEERLQAAVMYHLAPEIALRLWVLGEDPDQVERLYKTPLNLAEQLWCRSATILTDPPQAARPGLTGPPPARLRR